MHQNNHTPEQRGFYAWNKIRAGDFLIYVSSHKFYYEFLYVPGGHFFQLTKKDFNTLIDNQQLTFVEKLPKTVYDESLEWTKKNVEMSKINKETSNDEKNN